MLARVGTEDDPLKDALDAAERVRDIVRDLKIFSRSEEDTPLVPSTSTRCSSRPSAWPRTKSAIAPVW